MMAWKDYKLIAHTLQAEYDNLVAETNNTGRMTASARTELRLTASRLSNAFAKDNPKFNQDNFLEECGF
jgi:hypothetical protein